MLIPFVLMILIPFLIYDYIDKSKSLELIYNFGIFFIPFLIFAFYTQMSYFRAQKQISIIVERNFPDRIQLPSVLQISTNLLPPILLSSQTEPSIQPTENKNCGICGEPKPKSNLNCSKCAD